MSLKKLAFSILLYSLQAFSQEISTPLLEIRKLSETLSEVSESEKIPNVRMFLKTSGDDWEKVRNCGGTNSGTVYGDWFQNARVSDLQRTPRNEAEARGQRLALELIKAASRGDTYREQQIREELRTLSPHITTCGLDYSSITPQVFKILIQTRVQLGADLEREFLRVNRRAAFRQVIDCQREFREGHDPSLDCYKGLAANPSSLVLIKEAALLTLLLERNQKSPCVQIPQLTANEQEYYDVSVLLSPLYNRQIEEQFTLRNWICLTRGKQ